MAVAGSYEAALRAAGGAVALVDALLRDGEPCGVSALRPPGHHAEAARAMGFCFFNNVAVAAAHARAAHGGRAGADPRLGRAPRQRHERHLPRRSRRCCSARSTSGRCIRAPGPAQDAGSGAGEGFTVNLPVPGGSGDAVHGSLVEHVVAPLIRGWQPQLVLVSAGFDAHRADPLATLG